MKHLKIPIAIIFSIFFNSFCLAQQQYIPVDGLFNSNGALNITETSERYSFPLSKIKGSPYLDEDFSPGKVKNFTGYTETQLIRYNIHNDVMEVKISEDELRQLKRSPDLEIALKNKNFKYYRSLEGAKILQSGYFEVIASGPKVDFLLQRKSEYIPEKKVATAYGQPEPPEFKQKEKYFFYFHDAKKLEEITRLNEKKILKPLQQYDFNPKTFVKEEDLNLRKEEAAVKLINYLNQ